MFVFKHFEIELEESHKPEQWDSDHRKLHEKMTGLFVGCGISI